MVAGRLLFFWATKLELIYNIQVRMQHYFTFVIYKIIQIKIKHLFEKVLFFNSIFRFYQTNKYFLNLCKRKKIVLTSFSISIKVTIERALDLLNFSMINCFSFSKFSGSEFTKNQMHKTYHAYRIHNLLILN